MFYDHSEVAKGKSWLLVVIKPILLKSVTCEVLWDEILQHDWSSVKASSDLFCAKGGKPVGRKITRVRRCQLLFINACSKCFFLSLCTPSTV